MEDKLLYRDEVYAIQGAVFDVYKTMGNMWGLSVASRFAFGEGSLRSSIFGAFSLLTMIAGGIIVSDRLSRFRTLLRFREIS